MRNALIVIVASLWPGLAAADNGIVSVGDCRGAVAEIVAAARAIERSGSTGTAVNSRIHSDCLTGLDSRSASERAAIRDALDDARKALAPVVERAVLEHVDTPAVGERVSALARVLAVAAEHDSLTDVVAKDWVDFSATFYVGVEGTSVTGLKDKGTPLTGLITMKQWAGDLRDVSGPATHGWLRDLHLIQYFSLFLQSSAETSVIEGEDSGIETALDMDMALFTPVYRDRDSYGVHAFGPVVTAGYRKSHDVGTGARRYYAGIRSSHNPESYVDLLYGKTEGVRGQRVEVRGMIPISDFAGGSFNVGGAVNLAVSSEAEQTPDSVRVQIIWRARLNEFFGAD